MGSRSDRTADGTRALSADELAVLEDRFVATCVQAVADGVLDPDEVQTILGRIRSLRRLADADGSPS